MTDLKTCREAFEKKLGSHWTWDQCPYVCPKKTNGDYLHDQAQIHWEFWQAAWNARADQGGESVAVHINGVEENGSILYVHPGGFKAGDVLYTQPPRATADEVRDAALRELVAKWRANAEEDEGVKAGYLSASELYTWKCADELDAALAKRGK